MNELMRRDTTANDPAIEFRKGRLVFRLTSTAVDQAQFSENFVIATCTCGPPPTCVCGPGCW